MGLGCEGLSAAAFHKVAHQVHECNGRYALRYWPSFAPAMHEIGIARLEDFARQVEATRQRRGGRALDFNRHLDRAAALEY